MKKILLIICAIIIVLLLILIQFGNKAIVQTDYTVTSSRLPEGFDGFRIAQISDLHNAEFGKGNANLLKKLKDAEADIIVITGDLVDARDTHIDIALSFAEKAAEIAPCYYVTGNHEYRIDNTDYMLKGLAELGVTALRDECLLLERNGDSITLAGLNDIGLYTEELLMFEHITIAENHLSKLEFDEDSFKILLSHRPEFFSVYSKYNIDLTLCGHAHGGQIRLPFAGGLFAPGQGFLPEYDCGVYTSGNSNMVVSRGLGNSLFPVRFNNRPEIAVIELKCS